VADDLNTPLGQTEKKRRFALRIPTTLPQALVGALGLVLGAFVLWTAFASDPYGGEPVAVVAATVPASPPAKTPDGAEAAPLKPGTVAATAPPGDGQTVTIINGMSGKREQVVIPAGGQTEATQQGADQRIVETSRHGAIPKIGTDGARAAEIYAQPVKQAAKDGPRIAIVIEGLGIGASGTFEALGKLPGPVTLAFAPYGTDLPRWVARARSEGHEVLLQVPMEPFDYPDNDPGPQTLLTTLPAAQNIDRLHWFMSRFSGYVGVSNYMGARFTSNEQAVSTLLRETTKRGLLYFDDGTSPRSLAGQIATANNVPFAKADIVLDAAPTAAAIDSALGRLEAIARERGLAIGTASALPVSIDRIAQWAKAAESRGLILVPISAVPVKPKSS
jgi:polysaccharide deacetylase 2 family uncharacterized protein YibQ